jgi:hypothetical protein
MPADYCGPFTIDDIDLFGTLEQINVSFDDPIWNSADTCIRYADGAVAGTGNVNAEAIRTRTAVGAINATGTVAANSIRIRLVTGAITGSGTVVADAVRLRLGSGQINGTATVTALGGVQYSGQASVIGVATVNANAFAVYSGIGSVNGNATVVCLGRIIGDEWSAETAGSESWNPIPANDTIWTDKSIGNQTWQ